MNKVWVNQVLEVKQFIPFFLSDQLFFEHNDLVNGFVQFKPFSCNFSAFLVAQNGVQQGHDAQAGEDIFTRAFCVGGDADDAFFTQCNHGVFHGFDGAEQGEAQHGFHDVQLQLTR